MDSLGKPVAGEAQEVGGHGASVRSGLRRALQAAAVGLVVLLLAILGWQVFTKEEGRGLSDAVAAGEEPLAPDFELPRLDGQGSIRLSELRGKVVVLNFWASWCEPCKEESPRLQAAYERWRDEGVVVLGIDAQDFRTDANRFIERYDLTYPNVHDGEGSTLGRFGVTGFPETWFVDRQGRLVGAHVQGPVSDEQLEANIRLALESAS
jgi:cytochrome c biogenesis protein CcmG/thiol:disulfide interchange protein DsbE